ncbi:uncharacterized protein LOC124626519 [Ictalurus punctatus]|uniref:Uncharacterized protein LOC124626519 n=1 Tax=Ictalurus punctatus TaxID=7998 RepID=A0A9F7RAW6_ICTPU|nr:uncharacterized protein LOC124626519 [Ictalurus punctatus]
MGYHFFKVSAVLFCRNSSHSVARYNGYNFYTTLYDTKNKIPVYSAYEFHCSSVDRVDRWYVGPQVNVSPVNFQLTACGSTGNVSVILLSTVPCGAATTCVRSFLSTSSILCPLASNVSQSSHLEQAKLHSSSWGPLTISGPVAASVARLPLHRTGPTTSAWFVG